MRRYGKQPPAQLEQLGQDLGFGRKERAKLITEYGEETMRVKWTKAWLSVHVERPTFLRHVPPAHVESIPWLKQKKGHGRPLEVLAFIDAALTQRARRARQGPPPPDAEDIKRAARESAYTSDVCRSVRNAGEPVPRHFQNVVTMEAHTKQAERLSTDKAEEQNRKQIRSITEMLRGIAAEAARAGTDITPLLADLQRRVKQEQLKEAA